MAVVLLAVGLFVYAQVGSDLDAALDNSLRSRADDIATVADGAGLGAADEDRLVAADESLAQVIGPGGTVLYSSRGIGERALLGADELARARRGPIFIDRESVAGFDERVRLLARPTDNRVVVVVPPARRATRRCPRSERCCSPAGRSPCCSRRAPATGSPRRRCAR